MLTLQKRERLFSRLMKKKIKGGAGIYILALFILLFILVVFKIFFDYNRVNITYDTVDDALVTSLVSGCKYNKEENAISTSTVIFHTVSPLRFSSIFDELAGTPDMGETFDLINASEIYTPDAELESAYQLFVQNLKQNLKLDDGMNASISGIRGKVEISTFEIYNCYRNIDSSGNRTDFRFVRYVRQSNGTWAAYSFMPNVIPKTYSTFDHADVDILDTSVTAALTFDIALSDYTDWLMPGKTEEDLKQRVTYKRVVDITREESD